MQDFEWQSQEEKQIPIIDGDVRIVNLTVKVIFEFSDKIIADYDCEKNIVLEYKSGYIMKVLPEQNFVFKDEKTIFLSRKFKKNIN